MESRGPAAGWYADPQGFDADDLRYWDGLAWTEHRQRRQPPTTTQPQSIVPAGQGWSTAPQQGDWGAGYGTQPGSYGQPTIQANVAVANVSKSNGLAVASLVLGIGAFFFALIPIVGLFSVPFALVGLGLGLAGLVRANKGYEGGGLSITGIVTSVLALAVTAVYVIAIGEAADDITDDPATPSGVSSPATASSEGGTSEPASGSRAAPLPFGVAHNIGDGWTVKVGAFDADANAEVAESNMFNEPPEPGKRYVTVTPEATYTGDAETASTFDLTFSLVGDSGVTIEVFSSLCVGPEPRWMDLGDVFPGGTLVGSICFEVPESDIGSLVLIVEPTLALSGNRAYLALS